MAEEVLSPYSVVPASTSTRLHAFGTEKHWLACDAQKSRCDATTVSYTHLTLPTILLV